MVRSIADHARTLTGPAAGFLFGNSRRTPAGSLLTTLFLTALFVAGELHWVWFFRSGEMSFAFFDWGLFHGYYTTLQQAVTAGRIPYHIASPAVLTDRFLAIPEVPLSPQVLLLRWMSISKFLVINTLLLYAAGFAGCLLLRRRYRLGLFPFMVLFLLLNFSGWITAQLGVGHVWAFAWFLLPLFLYFVLEWAEPPVPRWNILAVALVVSAMFLQGSFHAYNWCMIALLLAALFRPALWRPFVTVLVSSGLIMSFRLVPGMLTYWNKGFGFLSGIPTVRDLFDGLTLIRAPGYFTADRRLGWWEYDYFVGFAGLAFLLWFGAWRALGAAGTPAQARLRAFGGPLAVMTVLALGYFYWIVTILPLPLVRAERVSSRFLVIPFAVLAVIAVIRLQEELPSLGRRAWLLVLAAVETAFEMGVHSYTWRVPFGEGEPPSAAYLSGFRIAWRDDPLYFASLKVFFLVSLVSAVACVVLLIRDYLRARKPAPG